MSSNPSMRKRGRPSNADITQRILHAAQACFARRGFDGFAMDDVARQAATSKTTLYLRFRTKQDLFKAAFDDLLTRLPPASDLTSGIVGESPEARLTVLATRAGALLSDARFDMIRRAVDADLPPALREHMRAKAGMPYVQAIRDYLRDEVARGHLAFEDVDSATSCFIALVAGPEALRSRWCGAAFGPLDVAHLHDAVRLFVHGPPRAAHPPCSTPQEPPCPCPPAP